MSASSLFLSPADATIDTRYVSPLNAPLSAGGFAISDVGSVSATIVRTEQIALPAGSLETKITVSDPLQASLSRSGTAVILTGQSSVVVTLTGVTATSVIVATLSEVDATAAAVWSVVPGAGSFTIRVNANATADTNVAWLVAKL
jgi:hypothetical protein